MPKKRLINEYTKAAAELLIRHDITVREYRSSYTGRAYEDRSIETPRPCGPLSFAIFAHEVGHVALNHFRKYANPRYVEEVEAWQFALSTFSEFKLDGEEKAYERKALPAIKRSFDKALRIGQTSEHLISGRYPVWWQETGLGA